MTEWYLPQRLVLVDELPRNATGKVEKNVLRERMAASSTCTGRQGSASGGNAGSLAGGQMPSENRAARCHFDSGDAPAEEDDKAVTVVDVKHAGVLGQRRDDMLGDLIRAGRAGFVVAGVQVLAADQPHT